VQGLNHGLFGVTQKGLPGVGVGGGGVLWGVLDGAIARSLGAMGADGGANLGVLPEREEGGRLAGDRAGAGVPGGMHSQGVAVAGEADDGRRKRGRAGE